MYKLKNVARRGSAFLGAVGLLAGISSSVLPVMASADSLNPLVERSLTLSSSSPGWAYTDGSGNPTYAPPNSGANGQKTGNYFSFRVSTDSSIDGADVGTDPDNPIKAMSFQYCTTSAGDCSGPGDDTQTLPTPRVDDASHTDLNVTYPSAAEVSGTVTDGTGTITLASGNAAVHGTSTSFTTELVVGSTIKTDGGNIYVVKSITDDDDLVLTTGAAANETDVQFHMSDFLQVINTSTGDVKAVPGYTDENPKYQANGGKGDPAEAAKNIAGNFIVMYDNAGTWTQSTGWTVSTSNEEETARTGKQNTIILQNSTGLGIPSTTRMKVLFFATSSDYITNPGSSYFFVKINTFKNFDALGGGNTLADNIASGDVIDGGVTVANVMNQSIQITTKVLETMEFSVGTVDPDTLDATQLDASDAAGSHIPCNPILTRMTSAVDDPQNVLQLGKQEAESSLETGTTYATHSYWRLSSNSSAGATVYYSGHTLSNTSGDEIAPIGTTASGSAPGSEQFGLALDTRTLSGTTGVAKLDTGTYGVDYSTSDDVGGVVVENGADNDAAGIIAAGKTTGGTGNGVDDSVLTDLGADLVTPDYSGLNKSYHTPKLNPLVPYGNSGTGVDWYGGGNGTIVSSGTAKFTFDPMSDTVPAPIASENNEVVDCVTGKMRYIANIAATTPAGIYTTKVNYIAAPQY